MSKDDLSSWAFITTYNQAKRVDPYIDFKEIERIHKEWERHDLNRVRRYWENRDMAGRYKVAPNDPKGPMLKYVPGETKFESGCTLTVRSSMESADE